MRIKRKEFSNFGKYAKGALAGAGIGGVLGGTVALPGSLAAGSMKGARNGALIGAGLGAIGGMAGVRGKIRADKARESMNKELLGLASRPGSWEKMIGAPKADVVRYSKASGLDLPADYYKYIDALYSFGPVFDKLAKENPDEILDIVSTANEVIPMPITKKESLAQVSESEIDPEMPCPVFDIFYNYDNSNFINGNGSERVCYRQSDGTWFYLGKSGRYEKMRGLKDALINLSQFVSKSEDPSPFYEAWEKHIKSRM